MNFNDTENKDGTPDLENSQSRPQNPEQVAEPAAPQEQPQWTAPGYYAQEPVTPPAQEASQTEHPFNPYQAANSASPYGGWTKPEQPAYQAAPEQPQAEPEPNYGYTAPQPPQGDAWQYQPQQPSYQQTPRRTRRIWPAVLVTAISCLLVGGLVGALLLPLFGYTANVQTDTHTTVDQPSLSQPVEDSGSQGEGQDPNFTFSQENNQWNYAASGDLADMAEAVTPSIVGVLNLTYQNANNFYGYGYYGGTNQTPDSEPSLVETGSGSGVIITEDGYIVTNAHVVDGADALKILIDGEEVDAVLVGSDSVTDLAVVKVDKTGLPAAQMGDSDTIRVGDLAVAIGNPLGSELAGTVTMGIVSAIDRTIEVDSQYIDVLQTDAAINPGNSGGALVNAAGQVIGITSAKTVVAGYDSMGNAISAEGIGYAIPINNAKPIIEQIIRTGRVPRPAMGVSVQMVTNRIDAEQMGLLVTEVYKGSAAEAAGLQVNDVITHMNGQSFTSLSEFKKELMKYAVGDTVTLTVSRNNEENITLELTFSDSSILEQEEEETPEENSQWQIPGSGNYGGFNPFG